MDDIKIRRGATFEETWTDTDLTASTITITVSDDSGIVGTNTATYTLVDGKMVATILLDTSTIPVGDYEYMYTIEYDGKTIKLPDPDDCGDETCELPVFSVCIANDIEESS